MHQKMDCSYPFPFEIRLLTILAQVITALNDTSSGNHQQSLTGILHECAYTFSWSTSQGEHTHGLGAGSQNLLSQKCFGKKEIRSHMVE